MCAVADELGDVPWSGVASGMSIPSPPRKSDRAITAADKELIEYARIVHDWWMRHDKSPSCSPCKGTGARRCRECGEVFKIPIVQYYGTCPAIPDGTADNEIYFKHFPFHYVWSDMSADRNGPIAPGTEFTIHIEEYVAGGDSIVFSFEAEDRNYRGDAMADFFETWLNGYMTFCDNICVYMGDPGYPGRAYASVVVKVPDDDYMVINHENVLCRDLYEPEGWRLLAQAKQASAFTDDNNMENTLDFNSLVCVVYSSVLEWAEICGYPLDYAAEFFPREFVDYVEARGRIRGAIQTIERAWRRARTHPDYAICKKWMRARAEKHGMSL